jgi:light-regulated signal transduction histidine kinase (bacteriophytochrome)
MLEGLTPEAPEVRIENRFKTIDGERWILWTNRALRFDDNRKVEELQSAGVDITDRRRAEEALRRANDALRRANADLEQFAYSASHDLQEPIRNISLSTQILAKHYGHLLDEGARQQLSFATEGAKRMEMLVRDLLTYAQSAQDGGSGKTTEAADANSAIRKALSNLATAIQESKAAITVGPLPTVPIPEVQLQQVFQNLIANAIKYRSDPDTPRIHVRAVRTVADWLFSIQDNGIGIAAEYRERVFGIFKRLHGEGKYSGTGIGLAICQRLVERNGGRIWVESAGLGKGSTFFFTLPAEGDGPKS